MTSGEHNVATSGLRPLSARSVILSVLLAAHPPQVPVAEIVNFAEAFGIQPIATRVALTRMVAAGDLDRTDATYGLSARLLARQHRQDRLLSATVTGRWDQRWRTVVIVGTGATATARAALRARLRDRRFAELREGVWLRPNNLDFDWSPAPSPRVEMFTAVPDEDPRSLAHRLFDLDTWTATATALIEGLRRARAPIERVTVAAAIVRHLLTDPLLPAELLDEAWPGPLLHRSYADYQHELAALRASLHD